MNPERPVPVFDLPEGVPSLNSFYLYITDGCNLHCRHCWITPRLVDGRPSPGECLDVKLLKKAVATGITIGLETAKLTGGEPVLHPRFIEIVDILSRENIRLIMETNATLIDSGLAEYLKKNSSIWFISCSLDSPDPDTHDRFRGVPGAFKAAVKGIENLVRAGYHPQIIMSPHHGNLHQAEDLIKLAVSLGAGSVKFNPVTPTGRGRNMEAKGETLGPEEILKFIRFVKGELQDRYPIKLIVSAPPALMSIREILQDRKAGGECQVLHILGILGNGSMALCGIGRNLPELCFGNLERDDLRDVWISHPVLNQLRKDMAGTFPGICGDCVHAKRCLTHCVAINYAVYGKLVHPYYLCQEAERTGAFPETRRMRYSVSQKSDDKHSHP